MMSQHLIQADYQCEDCESKLISSTLLMAHKMEVHMFKPGAKAKKAETDVQCKICGKYLKNEKTLATHTLQDHEKDKHKHRCDKCDYSTYESYRLKKHVNTVHKAPKDFKCIQCDYVTNDKKNLYNHEVDQHQINRGNLKVYTCDHCNNGRMFRHIGSLGIHLLNVHNVVTSSIHIPSGN